MGGNRGDMMRTRFSVPYLLQAFYDFMNKGEQEAKHATVRVSKPVAAATVHSLAYWEISRLSNQMANRWCIHNIPWSASLKYDHFIASLL